MESETWKDIPGYEGLYMVSDMGNVFSYEIGCNLSIQTNNRRYAKVVLSKNNLVKNWNVSQLVALAFIDKDYLKKGLVCDHINNDSSDDRLCNLQVLTPRHNRLKEIKDGGASFDFDTNKWVASIIIKGKRIKLGRFKEKKDAQKVYFRAVELENEYDGFNEGFRNLVFEGLDVNRFEGKSSNYPNVYWRKNRSRWVCSVTINGKRKILGSFKTDVEAYNRYLKYLKYEKR